MKKFLSSILMCTIALTSFSAVSCFASGDSTLSETKPAMRNASTQTGNTKEISTQTESQTEALLNKFKKVAGYVVAVTAVGACVYLGYNHGQDIGKYAKESYNNYIIPAKTWSFKTIKTCNDFLNISTCFFSISKKLKPDTFNKGLTLFPSEQPKTNDVSAEAKEDIPVESNVVCPEAKEDVSVEANVVCPEAKEDVSSEANVVCPEANTSSVEA